MSSRNLELDPETTTKLVLGCTDSTPTRRLLITVCIHGDEICGLHAVNELLKEGFFHDGFDTDNTQVVILLGIFLTNRCIAYF
jgi:succinylglutamate desuccinylase